MIDHPHKFQFLFWDAHGMQDAEWLSDGTQAGSLCLVSWEKLPFDLGVNSKICRWYLPLLYCSRSDPLVGYLNSVSSKGQHLNAQLNEIQTRENEVNTNDLLKETIRIIAMLQKRKNETIVSCGSYYCYLCRYIVRKWIRELSVVSH